MASNSSQPTVSLFGATGGCSLALLVRLLSAPIPYKCTALARTPSKLANLLSTHKTHPVNPETQKKYLNIVQGDVLDPEAVKKALVVDGETTDIVICSVGMIFDTARWWDPFPKGEATRICQNATRVILGCLSDTKPGVARDTSGGSKQRPLFVALSTTGLSTKKRDVPLLLTPLYHVLLAMPHADKREMERLIGAEALKPQSAFRTFAVLRLSLLTEGNCLGSAHVRVGREVGEDTEGLITGPAVGYTISREDVGNWMFEEIVCKDAINGKGGFYTLTY